MKKKDMKTIACENEKAGLLYDYLVVGTKEEREEIFLLIQEISKKKTLVS